VQLASVLFCGARAYADTGTDEMVHWLGLPETERVLPPRVSRVFARGGWVTMHAPDGRSWACIRFPAFRFRPSHADALHIDLWHDGANVLRDGGTFSYAAEEPWATYFAGTESHNTVMFDGAGQMARISRFLFADWLHSDEVNEVQPGEAPGSLVWSGSYRDAAGHGHRREVRVDTTGWTITDTLSGARDGMVARWRLIAGEYSLADPTCVGPGVELTVEADQRFELVLTEGFESRYYLQRDSLPVLEVRFGPSATNVTTSIRTREITT
jgi:hypothetical protein